MASIVIYCPDENITLYPLRLETQATGGGKAAILHLAYAWARLGNSVRILAPKLASVTHNGVTFLDIHGPDPGGDVAIFVTGSRGHFRDLGALGSKSERRILWINGPKRIEPPEGEIHWFVAPARFLADQAIGDWGWSARKVVVIRGDAVPYRVTQLPSDRYEHWGIWASHPGKGLDGVLSLIANLRRHFPEVTLHIAGSSRLWHDHAQANTRTYPEWATWLGELPPAQLFRLMPTYGFFPYLSTWVDGFSCATAEAMASGLVVIAAGHGANAEVIRHGWNGFLVPVRNGELLNAVAYDLLSAYFRDPGQFFEVRRRAAISVPTWDEQAKIWTELWE